MEKIEEITNENDNIIKVYLSWDENFENQISKLSELKYQNLISFYNDVLTIIYNDILILSEEDVCKKYNLKPFEVNKIKCVKTNYNAEGKQKGKKWVLNDEIKVKNWMMNPYEKSYQELCDELERSGVAIEARINYLLEKELFINSEPVNIFCEKYNIHIFTYYYVNNQTIKIEKKINYEEMKVEEEQKEEKDEKEENYNFLQPKWTNDEEKFLKVIIKNGKSVKEIGDLLKRSKDDIEQRIRILVYREFEDQIQNWSKTYKLSTTNLLSMCSYQIKKMSDKSTKKQIINNSEEVNNITEETEVEQTMNGVKSLFS
jgi:hypothetical protein